MDRQVMDTTELEELVRDERWIYEQITPPVADFVLRQPVAPVIPFDWEHFPENLPELLGDRYQYEYSVPVYKLRAVEDRQTRQLHFYDGKERLFSIPAPADYDPFAWLKTRYPDLYSGRHALSAVRAVEERYDPARIELLVTLIPTDYVEHYLYAQAKVREYQLSLKEEEDGGFMLLGMGTESNIVITAMTHTTNDLTDLDITLEDQPSIWGTLDYTGEATGDIHVLASATPNWDTTYSSECPAIAS